MASESGLLYIEQKIRAKTNVGDFSYIKYRQRKARITE